MKIFVEGVHTGADWGLFMTGYPIYTTNIWNYRCRPKPDNVTILKDFKDETYDVLLGASGAFFGTVKDSKLPIIWRNWGDFGKWTIPKDIIERSSAFVALNPEGIERHGLAGHKKATYIEHCADPSVWKDFDETSKGLFTVGNSIPIRPEKGTDVLNALAQRVRVDLWGWGNDGYPYWPGASENFDHLLAIYHSYRIFINPTPVISGSCLDAMVMGIPIITMPPGNMKSVFEHGKTAMIVQNVDEMEYTINFMYKNQPLCKQIGENARKILSPLLSSDSVSKKWRTLLSSVTHA